MQLTDHFSLREFEASDKAAELGIDNSVPPNLIPKLQWGCENILEPIREMAGSPLEIGPRHSGYRCPALNKAVGGAEKNGVAVSQHCRAEAADFTPEGMDHRALFDMISRSDLPFDQLILEPSWIHVSWVCTGEPRKQCLVAHPGEAIPYSPYVPR